MKFFSSLLVLPLALAAPILDGRNRADAIPGKWIVVLKDGASGNILSDTLGSLGGLLGGGRKIKPDRTYEIGKFKGFAITADNGLIKTIANLANVAYVEPDFMVKTQAVQNNPPYGLARISHRNKGEKTYVYDESAGRGVVTYGIDTGVYAEHEDFGGRASFAANFVDDDDTDGNGHGTHTAATMAGSKYGVAKNAQVVGIKVLSAQGSGATSGIMQGIQFAVNDMKSKGKKNQAVSNMSLGGLRTSNSLNQIVAAAVAEGMFFSIAAGNSGAPTLLFTPASEPTACTVGATDENDQFASFSNFGGGIDVNAPGVDVLSAWIGNSTATNTISGTSMAAPHVGGVAAYLLGLDGPTEPVALCNKIKSLSTKDKISGGLTFALGTPNELAFNGAT